MIHQVENPALEIHDLSVSYEKKPVLWGIDLTIPFGSLCGIIGPNAGTVSSVHFQLGHCSDVMQIFM